MKYTPSKCISINQNKIGLSYPTYFIADIAANHDGDLKRAKELIKRAADAGANAAKFQHFKAETIVSDRGFRNLGGKMSHQEKWDKSVFEVYRDASLKIDWTPHLQDTCKEVGIDFFTSPYSFELVDAVDPFVCAYKIGSGDITWLEIVEQIAKKGKPCLLATGASTLEDVKKAVDVLLSHTGDVVLMQCNTNYTASLENFKYIQLNVLKTYAKLFPDMILGLSDHTPGHATVLGAITLGARAIEKHFTDDTTRKGPDHKFSMDPTTWKTMVETSRELENALGEEVKKVEENEKETYVLQRRCLRAATPLPRGSRLDRSHLIPLRPCPEGAIPPNALDKAVGKTLSRDLKEGEEVTWNDLT